MDYLNNNNISKAFLNAFYNNFIPSFATACGYALGGVSCLMLIKNVNDRICVSRHGKSESKKNLFVKGDGKLGRENEGSFDISKIIERHLDSFEPVEAMSEE